MKIKKILLVFPVIFSLVLSFCCGFSAFAIDSTSFDGYISNGVLSKEGFVSCYGLSDANYYIYFSCGSDSDVIYNYFIFHRLTQHL